MSKMKALPIGIEDFKEMIDKDYYFVDKSLLIRDLLEKKTKVCLITRPRRFGKTLNMSMIRRFFEKTDEDNAYLFVQNENVYYRLFLFEEISNTVRICAMHTSDIRDVSVLEEIKIPEMESKCKIIGKVLAFLRKNNLF